MLLGKLIQQLGEENSDWEKLAGETYQISGFGPGKNIQFLVQSFPPGWGGWRGAGGGMEGCWAVVAELRALLDGMLAAPWRACILYWPTGPLY